MKKGICSERGNAGKTEAKVRTNAGKQKTGMLLIGISVLACLLSLAGLPRGEKRSYQGSGRDSAILTPVPLSGSIRINEADAEELIQLPGVGESLAQAILDERDAHGRFNYPEDLLAVKGIGPAKLESILPWICLE